MRNSRARITLIRSTLTWFDRPPLRTAVSTIPPLVSPATTILRIYGTYGFRSLNVMFLSFLSPPSHLNQHGQFYKPLLFRWTSTVVDHGWSFVVNPGCASQSHQLTRGLKQRTCFFELSLSLSRSGPRDPLETLATLCTVSAQFVRH